MQSSTINEILAGNHRASAQSQMLAEHAASEGLENLGSITWKSKENDLEIDSIPDELSLDIFLEKGKEASCAPPYFCYYLPIIDESNSSHRYIASIGGISSEGKNISVSEVILVTLEIPGGGNEWGEIAALAGSKININGASTLDGRVHANIEINANIEQRNEDLKNEENQGITSGFEISIPTIDFSVFDDIIELEREEGKGNQKGSYYCDFNNSGNLSGRVYYCDGDIEIGSSFENATLLSSGNVTNKGSITIGSFFDDVNTEIIAKGDISFSGASIVYGGWFLSGRDINQNGSSVFYGSMIAHRDINRNGSAEFIFKSGGGGDLMPTPDGEPEILYWH